MKTDTEISSHEFGFCELEPSEFTVCRNYEFGREHALGRKHAIDERIKATKTNAEPRGNKEMSLSPEQLVLIYPDLAEIVFQIRKNWKGVDLKSIHPEPVWHQSFEARALVCYSEWPKRPYLSIPKEKRVRSLKRLFPDLAKNADLADRVLQLQSRLRKLNKPASADKGPLLEQLAAVASLIQPNWLGPKRICRIAIPLNVEGAPPVYRRDIETAFSAWLRIQFPELLDYKERGRASEHARVTDDLNALAVYRLNRAGKKLAEIVDLVRQPGSGDHGSNSYSSIKKLDAPRRRFPGRVMSFYERVLNDLEPLEPDIPI